MYVLLQIYMKKFILSKQSQRKAQLQSNQTLKDGGIHFQRISMHSFFYQVEHANQKLFLTGFGVKLDSTGDLFLFIAVIFYLVYRCWAVLASIWTLILIVFILRMTNICIGFFRFKKLIMIHTLGNKAAVFLVCLLPIFMQWGVHLYGMFCVILVGGIRVYHFETTQ
jgi:hypothetical protein